MNLNLLSCHALQCVLCPWHARIRNVSFGAVATPPTGATPLGIRHGDGDHVHPRGAPGSSEDMRGLALFMTSTHFQVDLEVRRL